VFLSYHFTQQLITSNVSCISNVRPTLSGLSGLNASPASLRVVRIYVEGSGTLLKMHAPLF
jgi:hypothetical protein